MCLDERNTVAFDTALAYIDPKLVAKTVPLTELIDPTSQVSGWDEKNLQKSSPSPDRHRSKSAEPSIEPSQDLSNTVYEAGSPASYIMMTSI